MKPVSSSKIECQGRRRAPVAPFTPNGVRASRPFAAAEARGVALGEGLFQRLERYVALCLGLWIPGALVPALVILLVLGGITLLQRIWGGARRLSKAEHQG